MCRFIEHIIELDLAGFQDEIIEYVKNNKFLLEEICPNIIKIKEYLEKDLRNKILYENPSQDLKEAYEKLDRLLFYEGE